MDITQYVVSKADGAQPSGRVYYGNADPEGETAIVGGSEVVVGGWAAHEADRRRARWDANPRDRHAEPRTWYGGRTYVTGQDAVESLVTARCGGDDERDPLARAAGRLATAISQFDKTVAREGASTLWNRLNIPESAPVAVSTLTPADVRDVIPSTDPTELYQTAEDASILASGYARADEQSILRPPRPPALPMMPTREVKTRGANANKDINRLEKAAVPRASAIEAYRGKIATVLDTAATVLERAVDT